MFGMKLSLLGLLALCALSAAAEEIVVEDAAVFRALQNTTSAGRDRDWVRRVTGAMLADRTTSQNDLLIMSALQDCADGKPAEFVYYSVGYAGLMKVMPADKLPAPKAGDVKRSKASAITGEPAEFIKLVAPALIDGASTSEMWTDESKTRQLYFIAMTSPLVRRNVTSQIARELNPAWLESNISNGYAPFRGSMTAAYNRLTAASGDDRELVNFGREVLCDAGRLVDHNANGAVPDQLYQYLIIPQEGKGPCEL